MSTNDGRTAFPIDGTLRDYFAANALLGLIAEPIEGVQQCVAFELSDNTTQMFADAAYKFADAMLKAREK